MGCVLISRHDALPILGSLASYRRAWLIRDAVAAVTICAVLVPQALAYGQLAGLSPVDGLYAALAPLILYPLFASSRRLMVGPESGLAILTAVALAPLAAVGSARFAVLAAMLALLTGAVLIAAGALRLGFLADFFSRPVLIGFINGVALIIIVTQLPRFLGIKVHTDSTLGTLWQIVMHIGDAHWRTIGLGLVLLIVLALLGAVCKSRPGRAGRAGDRGRGGCVAWACRQRRGRDRRRSRRTAGVAVPHVSLGDIGNLVPVAGGLAFVGFAQSILTARAFAEPHGEAVDANRELIALGAGNIGAGLLHGFPSSSSQARTAVAETARIKTQLAQVAAGILVVAFLLWLTGVLHDVPTVALAAIVMFAAAGLIDVGAVTRLYRQDRPEFAVAIATLAGVVVLGMLVGILTAVFLSLALLIARISRPRAVVIGAVDGAEGFHELAPGQGLEAARGVVVYRFDAPLFFGNADYFVANAVAVFDQATPRRLVLDLEGVAFIDVTAARALKRLLAHVQSADAELCIARTRQPVLDQMRDAGLVKAIGEDHLYPTVRGAAALSRRRRPAPPTNDPGSRQ